MKKINNSENQLRSNLLWNLCGTAVNALTSLFYMIVVTRLNGLETAGVFSFAFSNACVLVVIGLYMGRTYQIGDIIHSNKVFIRSRQITCVLMLFAAIVMGWIGQYSDEKMIVFLLWIVFKMLEAYADVLYGIMQKKDHLDYVGKSLVLKASLSMIVFVILDYWFKNIIIASSGVVITAFMVLVSYDFRHYDKAEVKSEGFAWGDCFFILKDGFFVFAITLLTTYLINASKYAINSWGSDSEQAVYGILIMPATAMILVGQNIIQPFLLKVRLLYSEKKVVLLRKTIITMCLVVGTIGIVGIACAGTIGIPVLEIIYGVALSKYRLELMIVMLGATCYGCVIILTNILTLMHKNKMQLICFMLISVAVTIASGIMLRGDEVVLMATGLYCISMIISAFSLGVITHFMVKKVCE